ncbi:MAG: hypothetical protein WBN40_14150 [Pseudomonadales bacterium]
MNPIHERIKNNFPTVLITLLSIVQALALELLWNHVISSGYLFEITLEALLWWVQIAATLVGIILIWLVYAINAMRLRWLPNTTDSIFPFIVGLIEFALVADLGPDGTGAWLMLMAVVFLLMTWSAQSTLARARLDQDNKAFFDSIEPATLNDFIPQIAASSLLGLSGLYVAVSRSDGVIPAVAILATFFVLVWQFFTVRGFWKITITIGDES